MRFGLSTRWNACRHGSGEALVEEIAALGIDAIELGYDLTFDQVPGIRRMVAEKVVAVDSVHSYCPVPLGAPRAHPELFALCALEERERESAVAHTGRVAAFAAEMGARCVVAHGGHMHTRVSTRDLVVLCRQGRRQSEAYEKMKLKLIVQREKAAPKHLAQLRRSLDALLPEFEKEGVMLALENLPDWESVPAEIEMERLARDYAAPGFGYWHDIGHGQVRQNLDLSAPLHWLRRLRPRLAGLHIHDVQPPDRDHLMPPAGAVDFAPFREAAQAGVTLVLEPHADASADDIRNAVAFLRGLWSAPGDRTP